MPLIKVKIYRECYVLIRFLDENPIFDGAIVNHDIHFLFQRLWKMAWYSDLHVTRFILGLAELLWGLNLLWPSAVFSQPQYRIMGEIMPEVAWGSLLLLTGFFQWIIMSASVYHDRAATLFSLWNACLWIFIVVSLNIAPESANSVLAGEMALAVGASWIFIRSGCSVTGRRSTDHAGRNRVGH